MSQHETDPYWQHDFPIETPASIEDGGFGVRFRAHESEDRFSLAPDGDLVELRVRHGLRRYFHGKPYRLEPDCRLSIALHPVPPPTGEVGRVYDSSWEGLRQRDIGQAQSWYYPEDRTLILWECFLEAQHRGADPSRDPLHRAVWRGWENWLVEHSPGAERIVTTWEDLYDRPIWRQFLESEGFQYIDKAAFSKLVK